MLWNGFDDTKKNMWELFSGSHGLSSEFAASAGWSVLQPIDVIFGDPLTCLFNCTIAKARYALEPRNTQTTLASLYLLENLEILSKAAT